MEKKNAAAPGITGAQIDDINTSVNLFRGNVNLPVTLVSLPGRNGLDVTVRAFYQSNLKNDVKTWNREAPTDILGAGWHIPFDKIVVRDQTSGLNQDDNFYIITAGKTSQLYRTGWQGEAIVFELKQYEFWEVLYYPNPEEPDKERWEIKKEDGATYIFGGIQWGVKWGNWIGSSTNPAGEQYPAAWNLTEVVSAWGDKIVFEYEQDEVRIGKNPKLIYARSCRVKKITDVYERTVTFHYHKKNQIEIDYPYRAPASGHTAYQFSYEDKYLDHIDVHNARGERLLTLAFQYEFYNVAAKKSSDNRYKKRYLTAITETNREGEVQPGFRFTYYTRSADVNPGALKSVTYPQGETAIYHYEAIPLGSTATRAVIPSPGIGYVPQVWHGPDYVVITWYNQAVGKLKMDVYTWGGTWCKWTGTLLPGLSIDAFQIIPHEGFFVIYYKDLSLERHRIWVYRVSEYKFGEWTASELAADINGAYLTVTTGKDFVAVYPAESGTLYLYQWDPFGKRWVRNMLPAQPVSHVALAGYHNACVGAYYLEDRQELLLQVYYADVNRVWRLGGRTILNVKINLQVTKPELFLSMGKSFAAATYIKELAGRTWRYDVAIVKWRSNFTFDSTSVLSFEQDAAVKNPVAFSLINENMIGNAQHVFRYDGQKWVRYTIDLTDPGGEYSYSYGMDTAITAVQSGGMTNYARIQYDPYRNSWAKEASFTNYAGAGKGTVSGNYSTIGNELYYQDPTLSWRKIDTLPENVDFNTLSNLAPGYLAYQLHNDLNTYLLFLKDGAVTGPAVQLPGEKIAVQNAGWGKMLAGPSAVVTYADQEFDTARALHLYRVVNQSVTPQQTAYNVSRLTADDGYNPIDTFYRYVTETATYDPYGEVAQYVTVKAYRGSADGEDGYTEYIYFNGLSPDMGILYPATDDFTNVKDYFSLYNGQIYTETSYHKSGRKVASSTNYFYTYTQTGDGKALYGAYVRPRKKVEAVFLYAFELDTRFMQDLNNEVFTPDLAKLFAGKGVAFAEEVTVKQEKPAGLWTIKEAETGREFPVERVDGKLKVYAAMTTKTESEYNAQGQSARTVTSYYDSEGNAQRVVQMMTYGWEVYPELAQLHLFAPGVKTKTVNETQNVITNINVTTWKNWQKDGAALWTAHKTYVWDGTAGTERFDYTAWSESSKPQSGWIKQSEVLAVTPSGQPLETVDIDDIHHAVLYDRRQQLQVAQFSNTSLVHGEASYYGFEEYEDPQGWTVVAAAEPSNDVAEPADSYIKEGEAYTGLRCLVLPGNAARKNGLRKTFRPPAGRDKFILTCHVKTDFTGGLNQAGWEITLRSGAKEQVKLVSIGGTGGKWRYFHHVINFRDLGVPSAKELSLFVYNQQVGQNLLVDNIALVPFTGDFTATVYDPCDKLPTATLTLSGNTEHTVYDVLRSPVATIDYKGRPTALFAAHYWRRFQEEFDPAHPNSSLNITVRTDGTFANFRHGNEWQDHWETSAGWDVTGGQLMYRGGQQGSLTLKNADTYHDYGVRLKVKPQESINQPIGIHIGQEITIRWHNGMWELYDQVGHKVVATAGQPVMDSKDWLVIAGSHGILFFADGRQVLQHVFDRPISGPCAFFAANRIALDYILVFVGPTAAIAYQANDGKELQVQMLDDSATLVRAVCYDHLGRAAVRTKTARFEQTLPAYRREFVKTLEWRTTGVMTGEVAGYYPDDEGYPYSRELYDPSPLAPVIEQGAPGKLYAIDLTQPADQRHTVMKQYAVKVNRDFMDDLPAAQYMANTLFDEDKVPTLEIQDKAGRTIITRVGDEGAPENEVAITRNRYDVYGNKVEIKLPNAFQSNLEKRENFIIKLHYDFFGRLIKKETPDITHPFRYVYDKAGRIRFTQDPNGAANEKQYILYWLYDRLGRTIEEGVCRHNWDERLLKQHADDKTWLPPETLSEWGKRYVYDGEGADLNLLGRLAAVQVKTITLKDLEAKDERPVEG